MATAAEKIPQHLLLKAIDASHDGLVIIDARENGFPLIYVNHGFEKLTGYTSAEAVGKNFRVFQASDNHQSELAVIHAALADGEGCVATLRNSRKDGSMYWNELSITPVHGDDGTLTHFIGIQKDVTARIQLEQQLNTLTNIDPLIGISNRHHFDERFANLLSIAKRIHSELSVVLIELDYFKPYSERYGVEARDECLRKVGGCVAKSFVRTSDCVARYSAEEFAVVSFSSNREGLHQHTQQLCERVLLLNIPHLDSPHGVVTVSIGGIQRLPGKETTEQLIGLTSQKLRAAQLDGGNSVNVG
ncbi:MAG: diguanylate cyclase [Nitrosomonadales bacterium]|nr:diguanylate cyclase [Nitrosomonadales bacterium]